MPNCGRERLNSRFSITITRTQYLRLNSELKNFNGNTRFKNARLKGSMWNYGHELLNSRTSWVTCNSPMIRNIIPKDLELEDTTPLNDTQLLEFMRNLWV
ncbi:hypothetical protein MTR67_043102 [Solanum verrucosum]|uniref:Uncharacterized protein n=1 Tax=Solanum verrucosum TaxID=315347 RepID=A0AAF0UNT8_SOLVR|nr:hypothetical protein MTR67_043102 [Solanum verrucosum]